MATIVNGQRIEAAEIREEFERLLPHYQEHVQARDAEASENQLMEWARENLVERVLLQQEARKLDDPAVEEVDFAYQQAGVMPGHDHEGEIREALAMQLKVDRLVDQVTGPAKMPSEDAIRSYYRENLDQFTMPEQRRASHLVRHVGPQCDEQDAREDVLKAHRELAEGVEFESLVQEFSDCTEGGGDLGYFARGKMVAEFEDVVFAMRTGEISEPFRTPFGWHICKLYDIIPSSTAPLEEVRGQIVSSLQSLQRTEAVERFVDELKRDAVVEETD